ncbi:MAG TPA: helix-turn-helix domain-containing protein [Acidimicrobiia bacterium]|nr:helix-turn-helix domain-containing protein [Acidimicrobiia bacterium]
MQRLSDAGIQVFAERGYHAARVDDIVRAAHTSHGTFYLYFANKEDLLRALTVDCAEALFQLSNSLDVIDGQLDFSRLRGFLTEFLAIYRRYGVVIRAWMEGQVADRKVARLGVKAFTRIAARLAERIEESGAAQAVDATASVSALMAMLERFNYAVSSRNLDLDDDVTMDTLTLIVQRGFFGATV